jgi:hypothetical protein
VEGVGTCFAWSNRFQVRLGGAAGATFALIALIALLLGACGGSPAGTGEPSATAHERATHESTEAPSTDDDSPTEEQAPEPALCSDGTCSTCGSGLCPSGWYCDESAKGGPACGWLPQCAQKSSCGCMTKVLGSGCSCSDQGSGLHVTCK